MLSRRKRLGLAIVLSALIGCNGNYNSGDRVLVEKVAYDADVGSPNRFDVVVFKFPERPIKNSTPTNYIKRLLGLPGELIAILCGQLFVFHPDPADPPLFDDVNNKDISANDLWKPAHMHSTSPRATEPAGHIKMRKLFEQGKFTIVRKPPEVMLAMRRIVNDNDFQPTDMKTKRWAPAKTSSWAADDAKGFTHKGDTSKIDWLRYQELRPPGRRLACRQPGWGAGVDHRCDGLQFAHRGRAAAAVQAVSLFRLQLGRRPDDRMRTQCGQGGR